MHVHIIGPNLIDQSKGDFHIHAKGCADVTRNREYAAPDFKWDRENTVDVASEIEISEYIYSDQIGEGSMTAEEGVNTFYVFPCVQALPHHVTDDAVAAEDNRDEDTFHVEIHGEYGTNDGSIHLFNGADEVVMWDSAEWVEDPSLVYVIANAMRLGFVQGYLAAPSLSRD